MFWVLLFSHPFHTQHCHLSVWDVKIANLIISHSAWTHQRLIVAIRKKNAIFTITYTFHLRACPHWCPFPLIHNIPHCVYSVPWNNKLSPSPGPLNLLLLLPRTLFSPPSFSTDLVNFYLSFIFQLTYPSIASLTTTSLFLNTCTFAT